MISSIISNAVSIYITVYMLATPPCFKSTACHLANTAASSTFDLSHNSTGGTTPSSLSEDILN
jgi:hypothetical protein